MRLSVIAAAMLSLCARSAAQTPQAVDLAAARASMNGAWAGSLEYLDYTANKWFGIPVKVLIEDQGDGATMVRKADFDDGPTLGNVRITSVELFDRAKSLVSVGTFRKGRAAEVSVHDVRLDGVAKDASHWTMIEEVKATDDKRPAMLRLTTVRDGDTLTTLKQVDFLDDTTAEWISRNRTTLTRDAGSATTGHKH